MSVLRFLLSKSFFKTSFRIILTAVIFFIVLVVFLRLNTRHGNFILVPDLVGKNIEEFQSELVGLDLRYIVSDSGNYILNYADLTDHFRIFDLLGIELSDEHDLPVFRPKHKSIFSRNLTNLSP